MALSCWLCTQIRHHVAGELSVVTEGHTGSLSPPLYSSFQPFTLLMLFSTDKSWPDRLGPIASYQPGERRYFGACNSLLHYCFVDPDFNFYVHPRYSPVGTRPDDITSVILLVVMNIEGQPVLIVEGNDPSWVDNAELRYLADKQIRDKYALMLNTCPLPRLWGLSLLGTSMRVYCGEKDTGLVTPQPEEYSIPPADFLQGQWDLDLLSNDGFTKMKEIVADIVAHNVSEV